jgi:hypothetical protein
VRSDGAYQQRTQLKGLSQLSSGPGENQSGAQCEPKIFYLIFAEIKQIKINCRLNALWIIVVAPTIRAAIVAGMPWAEAYSPGCRTAVRSAMVFMMNVPARGSLLERRELCAVFDMIVLSSAGPKAQSVSDPERQLIVLSLWRQRLALSR